MENDFGYIIQYGEYYNTLDIDCFSQMMSSPSYSYKFFWLEAIVILMSEGKTRTTLGDIIDEMISNAWYPVLEYHIHLSGIVLDDVRDGIERAVLKLQQVSNLSTNASKTEIKNAINEYSSLLKSEKQQLTKMVPYRALSGFFGKDTSTPPWESVTRMVEYMRSFENRFPELPYSFGDSSGLNREVYFRDSWVRMINDNTVSILGWIRYEKVKWLQKNNPEIPGIVYKLEPMNEKMRKLEKVRKLWNAIFDIAQIHDIYNGKPLNKENYDVDHFVPWSFVMNDELWNLIPMDRSLNSSKSNRLPDWDRFFPAFSSNQYLLYSQIREKEYIHKLYDKCFRDNLHSIWAISDLYGQSHTFDEFSHILDKNMRPIYDSANRQGYEPWNFGM